MAPAAVRARFRALVRGRVPLRPAGAAREDPEALLAPRYAPRFALELFGSEVFLTGLKDDEGLTFFVGYVRANGALWPRAFYKDSSLMWRVASHYVHDEFEYWIGKGDVRVESIGDDEHLVTAEETTNLPFEAQTALDELSRRAKRTKDEDAIALVVREAPSGRIQPYADFLRPREAAREACSVHGSAPIARFRRAGDPTSLAFRAGYAPRLTKAGVLGRAESFSRFFGGEIQRVRIASENGRVQFLFYASPTHTWMAPPQALTSELSTYFVRVHDVTAPDDLSLPGYEYHEEDGPTQIPEGFAGAPHPDDPHRADAGAWLDGIGVLRKFRRRLV
ncbi:MAG: hypothetical protein AAFU73_22365 [Planctomycetota bacterium]